MQPSEGHVYKTITGRVFDLSTLTQEERTLLVYVVNRYRQQPEAARFGSLWQLRCRAAKLPQTSLIRNICEDLEARLGIAQGTKPLPGLTAYLMEMVEQRYVSREAFAEKTSMGNELSRVLEERHDITVFEINRLLGYLNAVLIIVPQDQMKQQVSVNGPMRSLEALCLEEQKRIAKTEYPGEWVLFCGNKMQQHTPDRAEIISAYYHVAPEEPRTTISPNGVVYENNPPIHDTDPPLADASPRDEE